MRHGKEKAVVEIELKGLAPSQIVTIRRVFTIENKSEWKLDGFHLCLSG